MSQFKYLKEINNLTRMDEAVKGPVPRWQKKVLDVSNVSNISANSSRTVLNVSKVTNASLSIIKSPEKVKKNENRNKKTPSRARGTTPAKTPTGSGGDRFIPSRSMTNFDLGFYKLHQHQQTTDQDADKVDNVSPTKKEMQRFLEENLNGGDMNNMRILSYQNKAPAPPEGYQNALRVVYSQTKTPAMTKSATRHIPQAPDRILDAPDIVDDYYLNLIDWSPNNILAVALDRDVYLWNATTGTIEQLLSMEGTDYPCSVAWIQEGPYLAVGISTGATELYDCSQMKRLRVMCGHAARVGSLSWNSHILSSGCRGGEIIHHDVRQREHVVSSMSAHSGEVCGLKWSLDGKYLASGGNDNMLHIWPAVGGQNHSHPRPIYSMNQHQAAVKALAWCPWSNHILASGGGTADRSIRFWNCNIGQCLNTVDTKSQVCSLLWSTTYKELVSSHGYVQNQLTIWKYPAMTKVAELTGHTSRVLHLAMSPDGTTVLSASADETLRLWKCFQADPQKKKQTTEIKARTSKLKSTIR